MQKQSTYLSCPDLELPTFPSPFPGWNSGLLRLQLIQFPPLSLDQLLAPEVGYTVGMLLNSDLLKWCFEGTELQVSQTPPVCQVTFEIALWTAHEMMALNFPPHAFVQAVHLFLPSHSIWFIDLKLFFFFWFWLSPWPNGILVSFGFLG